MYIPKHFQVSDRAPLFDLMQRHSFATLVTVRERLPFASMIPFLLQPEDGEHGTLVSHMARANPQWQDFAPGVEALAIFQGPHTYISPSWYETHPSVPTWNYAVVHAYGVPRLIEDDRRIRAMLRALVDQHEAGFEEPWPLDLPDEYMRKMVRGIVAFEMQITRLEGKFKLSQNRSVRDQDLVIEALAGSDDAGAQGVRAMMEASERRT